MGRLPADWVANNTWIYRQRSGGRAEPGSWSNHSAQQTEAGRTWKGLDGGDKSP